VAAICRGGSYQPLACVAKSPFVGTCNMVAPTNAFVGAGHRITHPHKSISRIWKKNRKKTRYNFFDEICTLAETGFERLTWSLTRTLIFIILHNHLWLYGICYSFILTPILICRSEWAHGPAPQIYFLGGSCHCPPYNFFYFIPKVHSNILKYSRRNKKVKLLQYGYCEL